MTAGATGPRGGSGDHINAETNKEGSNTMSKPAKEGKGPTRLERARIVREAVLAISATHGHWEEIQLGAAHGGRTTRLWTVESGQGWSAWVDTRFTRPVSAPNEAQLYASAVHGLGLPTDPDHCVDVIWEGYGKVMSISRTGGIDSLIGFTAGPWEAAFGLPAQDWSPAIARKLASRAA